MSQSFDYSQSTIEYYNKNSLSYYEQTVNIDMSTIYEPFLELIPKGGHILDAGCGSGRDTKEFLCRGYKVTAIDASEAMVKLSSELTGQQTLQMTFQDLAFDQKFDGIWTCASLLHVRRNEMSAVLSQFIEILNYCGIWYISLKVGYEERIIDNRLFNEYTKTSIEVALSQHPSLEIIKVWNTLNCKGAKVSQEWLNILLTRR